VTAKKKHPPGSLDEAVDEFAKQYKKRGSGISSVSNRTHSIKVIISKLEIASKLPGTFNGFPVNVWQDLGPAGEKAIIRDTSGKVVGYQG